MKAILRRPGGRAFLAGAAAAYGRLLAATMRWSIENTEAAEAAVVSPDGALAMFWHGRIALAMGCKAILGAKARRIMVSRSRDGEFIAAAALRLGVPVIRGSARREAGGIDKGGGAAFLEAVRFVKAGGGLLVTPDGPRGPAEVVSSGSARLAQAAGAPVFLAGLAGLPVILAGSWDRARIPLPFARGALVIEGPLPPPLRGTDLELTRLAWTRRMQAAEHRAKAWLSPPASLALPLYRLVSRAAHPLARSLLQRRVRSGREDPARLGERLGRPSLSRPAGPIAWLHGVSVGEATSLAPLAEALVAAGRHVLMTTGTPAGAEVVALRAPAAQHQFAPVDTPTATHRFLAAWRPARGVMAESELWPNLVLDARRSGVRLALVSAALSEESVRHWRRAPGLARRLFWAFELVLARDEGQAEALARLGARVDGVADLKFGAAPLANDEAARARLASQLAGRRLVLAASTHAGEEAIVIAAWRVLAAERPDLPLLAIAPRHPARAAEVARLARAEGFRTAVRSLGEPIGEAQIYVADTLGELGLLYRLADFAILGGSLVAGIGGHNPLEPARLATPLLIGSLLDDWRVWRALRDADAAEFVEAADLASGLRRALDAGAALTEQAARARAWVEVEDRAARAGTERVLEFALA